ncbi:hypothetical protein BGZ63DRAFT_404230 [Mariannaea sp. PMI_226]|nr:hypothetical protein BGZ63DRAFT_404230 [Mariannaea sp. PMI_226]
MASPMPYSPNGSWNQNGQAMPQNSQDVDDSGIQIRPMGLKVHYTFDKENKVNCLARSSQTLQVQTIPLDDKNSIGIVDIRVCMQAVADCSPELINQETDYNIYALDYSEPDTPLVGQGMLSSVLESMHSEGISQSPKMVTGRVTRNVLAVFGNGNRDTLEVKLRLAPSIKVQRLAPQPIAMDMQPIRPMETAMTPTGVSEWNSFIQSNPQIGHSAHVSRVASPALSQGLPAIAQRRDSFGPTPILPAPEPQREPLGPTPMMINQEIQRVAPVPIDPSTMGVQAPARPSSRSSTKRKKKPTGRPRGRPRKKPGEGNTSGYEDGTEGEDGPGPATKRAKITQVEKVNTNPFATGPESLRVAASTSGSLRNFRPIGMNTENAPGNHLQEVPRAPTPVPEGGPMNRPPRSGPNVKPRRESSMRQEFNQSFQDQSAQKPLRALSPSQEDGRSPESLAPTPIFSEDSPQDIGSSPPVNLATSFIRSSPPPSSPMLPPMPQRAGSSYMDADVDELFDEAVLNPLKDGQYFPNPPVLEVQDSTGIPTQVFQIQNGPGGQGLVHIQNYNTPLPSSTPARPAVTEAPAGLPPLKNSHQSQPQNMASNKSHPSPPMPALTPPPTTDSIERAVSPTPVPEASTRSVAECSGASRVTSATPVAVSSQGTSNSSYQSSAIRVSSQPPLPNPLRQMGRSQSAGPLILPTIPVSEPAGPSSLSQATSAEPSHSTNQMPSVLRRANSFGPNITVPASDPVGPSARLPPLPAEALSEAPCPADLVPPSSPRWNKNKVKKHSIKQRLDDAVAAGEMPPFCTNCGAIETPTWRKIWIQDREGVPDYVEYSEKPGRITAIEILKRDGENKPLAYRLVKKSLGIDDDRSAWLEQLLCNPCGIWVTKYRSHRPSDKWDNSFGRLGQERRKRGPDKNSTRSKKARTKTDMQPNPTSEAYLLTDPIEPMGPSLNQNEAAPSQSNMTSSLNQSRDSEAPSATTMKGLSANDLPRSQPGSTHSRGSGTAQSPINIGGDERLEEQLGSTRRLLFPSPRKDNTPKVLQDLDVNIIQTTECRQNKELAADKENVVVNSRDETSNQNDDLEALFQSPALARPSTPPPKAAATATTPFKTPTRPTPSHRPITRSVSRSLRSVRDMLMSPNSQSLLQLQQTPTKTPRGPNNVLGSASRRRSPRNQVNFDNIIDTPLSRTISQMLSDPAFDLGNNELDFSALPSLDANASSLIDFGNLLSTDGVMPSSPPKDGALGFDYHGSSDIWAQWGIEQKSREE